MAEKLPVHALRDQGVAVQALGSRWPIDVIAFARLARLRRQLAADVTHAWDMRTLAQAAMSGDGGRGMSSSGRCWRSAMRRAGRSGCCAPFTRASRRSRFPKKRPAND